MYTSYIGQKFLKIYRQRNNLSEDYTAYQFFTEEMFPLFFNDDMHLMHVGNSPFFQKPTKLAVETHGSKSKAQFFNLKNKIKEGIPSGSIFVGYGAENMEATSSGQISSLPLTINEEEIYASWIGQALAIGVSGGLAILIPKEKILWSLYEGWSIYKKYLSQTPNLKDKQIETWNGHWLNHVFGKNYYPDNPLAMFNMTTEVIQGNLAIPTIAWLNIIVSLSKKYPNQILTGYVYNLAQTNTTLGFINFDLPKVKSLSQLKSELFPSANDRFNRKGLELVYSTFYNFKTACKLGVIGLKALEPKNLRDYMPEGTSLYTKGKNYKFSNTNIQIKKNEEASAFELRQSKAKEKYKNELVNFQLFKTWIIAMLNNKKELNTLAVKVAQTLIDFEESENNRGKTSQIRMSESVKSAKSLRAFIEELTEVMKKYKDGAQTFKEVKDTVIELPSDLFPLFITLVRFEYQFKKSI